LLLSLHQNVNRLRWRVKGGSSGCSSGGFISDSDGNVFRSSCGNFLLCLSLGDQLSFDRSHGGHGRRLLGCSFRLLLLLLLLQVLLYECLQAA